MVIKRDTKEYLKTHFNAMSLLLLDHHNFGSLLQQGHVSAWLILDNHFYLGLYLRVMYWLHVFWIEFLAS